MKIFSKLTKAKKIAKILWPPIIITLVCLILWGVLDDRVNITKKSISFLLDDYLEASINKDIEQLAATIYKKDSNEYHRWISENPNFFEDNSIDIPQDSEIKIIDFWTSRYSASYKFDASVSIEFYSPNNQSDTGDIFFFQLINRELKWYIINGFISDSSHKYAPSSETIDSAYQGVDRKSLRILILEDEAFFYRDAPPPPLPSIIVKDKSITSYIVQETDIINRDSFINFKQLASITLPKNFNQFDPLWFATCDMLTRINVDPNSPHFKSVDGVLYNKDGSILVYYPKGKLENINSTEHGVFHIPQTVRIIGKYAFSHNKALRKVIFDDSVKTLSDNAFYDCINLENVSLNSQLTHIGNQCFYNNVKLSSVTLPSDSQLSYIGLSCFEKCSSLKTITLPESVKKINNWVFQDCTALEEINLSSQLSAIGLYSFRNCKNLKSLFISQKVGFIDRGAFSSCDKLTLYIEFSSAPKSWDHDWDQDFSNNCIWNSSP